MHLNDEDSVTVDLKAVREKIRILRQTKGEIEPEDLTMEGEKSRCAYKIYVTGTVFFSAQGEVDPDAGISLCVLLREKEGK